MQQILICSMIGLLSAYVTCLFKNISFERDEYGISIGIIYLYVGWMIGLFFAILF